MTLLHTEYWCDQCRFTLKKLNAKDHTYETGHLITKKIIVPAEEFEDEPSLLVEPSKPVECKEVDYCVDCSKEAFAPALHKMRGHMVYVRTI